MRLSDRRPEARALESSRNAPLDASANYWSVSPGGHETIFARSSRSDLEMRSSATKANTVPPAANGHGIHHSRRVDPVEASMKDSIRVEISDGALPMNALASEDRHSCPSRWRSSSSSVE